MKKSAIKLLLPHGTNFRGQQRPLCTPPASHKWTRLGPSAGDSEINGLLLGRVLEPL